LERRGYVRIGEEHEREGGLYQGVLLLRNKHLYLCHMRDFFENELLHVVLIFFLPFVLIGVLAILYRWLFCL
jgi:hypothetical protein